VSGADVKVESSSGEVFILAEDPAHPGRYQTPDDTAAIPGTTYTLTVKVNNNGVQELYSAISTMPAAMTLDFIRIKSVTQMGRKSYSLSIYAQDPPEEDYYLGIYQINDSLFDKISKYTLMDDKRFNGQYLDGWQFKQFGAVDEDGEDDDPTHLKQGDAVTLYFSRVEKGYYDFIHQCRNEMNGESPFSGPAANITTNISGGGAGYFTAYAVSKATAVPE
jgi:hypothetical protein